jgi:hypothetical protein
VRRANTLFGPIQNEAYFQNEMPRTLCTDVPLFVKKVLISREGVLNLVEI